MSRAASKDYIQYGCGLTAPDGWRNFDASPVLRLRRLPLIAIAGAVIGPRFPANVEYGDVTKSLPIIDSSAKMLFCSHVLEHLALEDCRRALKETYRILKPGGIFRMVLPDLETIIASYWASRGDADAAPKFMRSTILGHEARPRGVSALLHSWLGNSHHRWMWDYASLSWQLTEHGFVKVRRARLGDNPDPMLSSVEDPDRWLNALAIECEKPQT